MPPSSKLGIDVIQVNQQAPKVRRRRRIKDDGAEGEMECRRGPAVFTGGATREECRWGPAVLTRGAAGERKLRRGTTMLAGAAGEVSPVPVEGSGAAGWGRGVQKEPAEPQGKLAKPVEFFRTL